MTWSRRHLGFLERFQYSRNPGTPPASICLILNPAARTDMAPGILGCAFTDLGVLAAFGGSLIGAAVTMVYPGKVVVTERLLCIYIYIFTIYVFFFKHTLYKGSTWDIRKVGQLNG